MRNVYVEWEPSKCFGILFKNEYDVKLRFYII